MKKEANEFALAVRKAKAAGMKAGDKFKDGDQEPAFHCSFSCSSNLLNKLGSYFEEVIKLNPLMISNESSTL